MLGMCYPIFGQPHVIHQVLFGLSFLLKESINATSLRSVEFAKENEIVTL